MALATAEAIRDRIYNLIEALTPTTDATKFRRYRNEWGADFIAAAESNPAAMLRRLQVREVGDDEPPITTGVIEERVTVRYQMLIAYPQSHRYGRDNAVDRDDVMNQDWKAINFKIGIYGRGNFSTATDGSYDATPLGAVRDMERGDGVDLLVIDVPFEFYRATGVEAAADPDPTWSVDATSGIAVPADATEWDAFITSNSLSIAAPDSLWLCQEASGDLADSIGALGLTANGSPAYQQAVTGWTRTGVKGNALTTSQRFRNASGPNPATTSIAMLALVQLHTVDASVRSVFGYGAISDASVSSFLSTTGRFRYRESGNISDTNVSNDYQNRVQPVLLLTDHTGTRARLYTDIERLTPTYGLPSTSTVVFLGAESGTWANSTIAYACMWSGADAEISDANVKALLEAMGWTVPWS